MKKNYDMPIIEPLDVFLTDIILKHQESIIVKMHH